jgi:hypothetical protein
MYDSTGTKGEKPIAQKTTKITTSIVKKIAHCYIFFELVRIEWLKTSITA